MDENQSIKSDSWVQRFRCPQQIDFGKDSEDDIKGSRDAIALLVRKNFIYFLCILFCAGAVMFFIGLVTIPKNIGDSYTPWVCLAVGWAGTSFFLQWFISSFMARHFLLTIKKLEDEIAELRNIQSSPDRKSGNSLKAPMGK